MFLINAGKAPTVTAPFAIDGTPQTKQATGSSIAMTGLSTTYGNVVMYMAVESNGGPVTGVTDSAGNTWSLRARADTGTATNVVELWSAKSASALSSNVITATTTSSSFYAAAVFAFSGAAYSSPYDGNGAIPNAVNTNSGLATWTTSNANDILIGIARATTSNPTSPGGWTQIAVTGGFVLIQYKLVSATQSGVSFAFGTGGNGGGSVCDAIKQGP